MTYVTSDGALDSSPLGRHEFNLRRHFNIPDDKGIIETIGPDGVTLSTVDQKHGPSVLLKLTSGKEPELTYTSTRLDIEVISKNTMSPAELLLELLGGTAYYHSWRDSLKATLSQERTSVSLLAAGTLDRVTGGYVTDQGTVALQGHATGDFLMAGNGAIITTGWGDDDLTAGNDSSLYGGGGDDLLRAGDHALLSGGDGKDHISGGAGAQINGGYGNDEIQAGAGSIVQGGAGNDSIRGGGYSRLEGGDGDDRMSGSDFDSMFGGWGNDVLRGADNSRLEGGDGNDDLSAGNDAVITDKQGDNKVRAQDRAHVTTADGDDIISVGTDSFVDAGMGNDRIQAEDGSTIRYERGDGHDVVRLGKPAQDGNQAIKGGATLAFGAGITLADLSFSHADKDLVVKIGEAGSITIENPEKYGLPRFSFANGETLNPDGVAAVSRPLTAEQEEFIAEAKAWQRGERPTPPHP